MWLSILPKKDLDELTRIGKELEKGNKTEQKLAVEIQNYLKNREEIPFLTK